PNQTADWLAPPALSRVPQGASFHHCLGLLYLIIRRGVVWVVSKFLFEFIKRFLQPPGRFEDSAQCVVQSQFAGMHSDLLSQHLLCWFVLIQIEEGNPQRKVVARLLVVYVNRSYEMR